MPSPRQRLAGGCVAPASYRLVGDDDPALSQKQLHIPHTEAEHMIQPYGMADDPRGKPMAVIWVGWRFHAASLARTRTADQSQLP